MADVGNIYIGDTNNEAHLIHKKQTKIVTWADGTDEEIAAMLEAHYNGDIDIHDYWSVGDEREVSLDAISDTLSGDQPAQSVTFVLSNVGGITLSDGVTECAFQVDQKDTLAVDGRLSNESSPNVWSSCYRRTWLNTNYKNALPSTLVSIFKEFINQVGKGNNDYAFETITDYFSLRAEKEITGSAAGSYDGNISQATWYQTSTNRIKYKNNVANSWWCRSPRAFSSNNFCMVNTVGNMTYDYPNSDRGIAPFGCI